MSAFTEWLNRDAQPWQFWRPQSGMPGGIIAVLVMVMIAALYLAVMRY
jgi:hypothetical protein